MKVVRVCKAKNVPYKKGTIYLMVFKNNQNAQNINSFLVGIYVILIAFTLLEVLALLISWGGNQNGSTN